MLKQPMEVREDGFKREKEKKEENLRKLKDKAYLFAGNRLNRVQKYLKDAPSCHHAKIRRWTN